MRTEKKLLDKTALRTIKGGWGRPVTPPPFSGATDDDGEPDEEENFPGVKGIETATDNQGTGQASNPPPRGAFLGF